MKSKRSAICGAIAFAVIEAANAHVTLETTEARAGSTYKAVFRVPHGCDGSATIAVRVQVPEGVVSAKPMPKPGWTLETVKGPYGKSYDHFGRAVSEGVKEVVWSGGKLPDDWFDEFVLQGFLAADLPTGMLYFPVVQECEEGVHRWIEIPAEGKSSHDYEEPAPGLEIVPGS